MNNHLPRGSHIFSFTGPHISKFIYIYRPISFAELGSNSDSSFARFRSREVSSFDFFRFAFSVPHFRYEFVDVSVLCFVYQASLSRSLLSHYRFYFSRVNFLLFCVLELLFFKLRLVAR